MTLSRHDQIRQLHRERPRSLFVRLSVFGMLGLVLVAWLFGGFFVEGQISMQRWVNVRRFIGELVPYPLQGREFDLAAAFDWLSALMTTRGWQALWSTLAISITAIVIAAVVSALFALLATRSLASARPFVEGGAPKSTDALYWRIVVGATRLVLIFLRAVPEYVWAFLLLALFGPSALPVVLALVLHNTGILGKIFADVVENLPREPQRAMRALGASRLQIATNALFPAALTRCLSIFFYRWETCVREATVLGMLGIASLGFWIQDARARNFYDEMFAFVLLGALLVVCGDFVSMIARRLIRNPQRQTRII